MIRSALSSGGDFTDDAAAAEKMGSPVFIVEGERKNIKITTIEDIAVAEALLKMRELNKK